MNNHLSLFYTTFSIFRRALMIWYAMAAADKPWLQLILFTLQALMTLVYLVFSHPFEQRVENRLNMANEFIALTVCYLLIVMNGVVKAVPTMQVVGDVVAYILYF